MIVMFVNSFSTFGISEDQEKELFVLCEQLKTNKSKNSPWSPFFPKKQCSKPSEDFVNAYEISEVSADEFRSDSDDSVIILDDEEEQMCVNESESKSTDALDQVLEDQLLKLKEILHDIKNDYPHHQCCPEVAIFNSVLPCQAFICFKSKCTKLGSTQFPDLISHVCEALELSALSDTAIAVVLNSLSVLEPAISLITAASVIHHSVYSRMKTWISYTPRMLTTVILMFTKKYPKAIIDELLLPSLKDESFDVSQAALIQDIMRNGLPDDQVQYCLRVFLEISSPNENTFVALQCLLERKVSVDINLCHILVERMYSWSTNFNSSNSFSKLLKSILSICGSQMTGQQLSVLNTVVMNNTTFLKKTIQSLIKRLIEEHDKSV